MITYSFIIPHRNSPDLLLRCVNSIPEREDVEIIIVDDNSDNDKKPSINRKGLVITYLNANEAKRAGHARNIGIGMATGRWLLFADADDFYCNDIITILDKYKESPIDVLYFNHYRKYENGKCFPDKTIEKYYGGTKYLDEIKYKNKVPWNKMVKRDFVLDNHILFEESINGNDMFFSYQVGYKAKSVDVCKTPLYYYEVSTIGSMTNTRKYGDEYYLCRLNHWYQTREFYIFINHPEWNSPIFMRFLAVLYRKGLSQFLRCCMVYFRNYQSIKRNKYNFVESMR